MRNREHMAAVAAGIEAMTKEEAGYWLGMAMHRKHPRRVLMALRFLLIEPNAAEPPSHTGPDARTHRSPCLLIASTRSMPTRWKPRTSTSRSGRPNPAGHPLAVDMAVCMANGGGGTCGAGRT
jgi:hypothetical protein